MDLPETRYAWNDDNALAYQVLGEGPADLVYLQGVERHRQLGATRVCRFAASSQGSRA